jgi:hypothetical protein
VSQSSSAPDRDEPGGRDLDDEIRALIAGYQELHQHDERVRRIGRRTYTGRPAGGDAGEDRILEVREEEIAPALQLQDLRGLSAGMLRTEEDMAAYAARFAQRSTPHDPAGKDLDRQAHAVDAAGTHWLLMVGQNRDHGLVACRFVREKGIPHARIVSFTAARLPLPVLVVELDPQERP